MGTNTNNLKERRVAVIATDGFEESELTETTEALKQAGAKVDIIAPHDGKIQAFRHDKESIQVKVDRLLPDVRFEDYDDLLLPGGARNASVLRKNPETLKFVREFEEAKKPIAAICHAPWILISAGLVEGRILTSYPDIKEDLKEAGAQWTDQVVVLDRNWVTSRSPDDIPAFNREMIKLFHRGESSVIQIAESA